MKPNRTVFCVSWLLACAILSVLAPRHSSWALSPQKHSLPGAATFSLKAVREPLESVLASVTKETGYSISIDSRWKKLPVTLTLDKTSIEDGLKKILRSLQPFSYTMSISGKTVYICIVEKGSNGSGALTCKASDELSANPSRVDQADLEAIPPEKPGERGVALAQLDASVAAYENSVTPSDVEAIPPEKPGERGVTLGELDASVAAYENSVAPSDLEAIPPEKPGEHGVTLGEIDASVAAYEKSTTPTDSAMIPPDGVAEHNSAQQETSASVAFSQDGGGAGR